MTITTVVPYHCYNPFLIFFSHFTYNFFGPFRKKKEKKMAGIRRATVTITHSLPLDII